MSWVLYFDGVNDYVQLPSSIGSTIQSSFTIAARLKTSGFMLLDKGMGFGDGTYYGVEFFAGTSRFFFKRDIGKSTSYHRQLDSSSLSILNSRYTHVAMTYNKSTGKARFYVDDIYAGEVSTSTATIKYYLDRGFSIGAIRRTAGGETFYKGYLDKWSLWSGVCDETDLAEIRNGNYGSVSQTPTVIYELEEGTGSVLYDSSGNNYNATRVGATWVQISDAHLLSATAHGHATGTAKPLLGHMGWALQCDGIDDYISLGTLGNFGNNLNKSVILITFKTQNGYSDNTVLYGVHYKVSELSFSFYVRLNTNNNAQHAPGKVYLYVFTGYVGNIIAADISAPQLFDGLYHTLEIDYRNISNGKIAAKVDGQTKTATYRLSNNIRQYRNFGYSLTFGARNDAGTVSYFSQVAIKYIKITVNQDVFAEYPIDEGIGTTINDASGNGYHGTIYGASWITDALISISTISADNISASRMNVKGKLLDLGDHTQAECYFQYTTDPNFNTGIIETPHQIMTTTGEFEQLVTNLDNSNTYYYRAVADYID